MRGAWIEIGIYNTGTMSTRRRSPCGGRGLKYGSRISENYQRRSLPMRERGLKYTLQE